MILTIVALQLSPQIDSVERQILNSDSRSVIISKERSLLLDKFLVNDIEKVKEIKNYLIEKEDENYIALYPAEHWLILYWTNEFEELLFLIKNYNPKKYVSKYSMYSPNSMTRFYSSRNDTRIAPLRRNRLFKTLLQYSKENEATIINQIQSSNMNVEKKRFLQLHFENMIKKSNSYQDTLNIEGISFLETFPESQYNYFIRNHVVYKFVLDDLGGAFEMFGGYSFLTGYLYDNYSYCGFVGGAFDFYYKKFEIILRIYGGAVNINNDMKYTKGFYPKGSDFKTFFSDLSLGFTAFENHRIKLAPYSGFGAFYFFPSSSKRKEIPELRELSVASYSFNCGVSFDIRLSQKPKHTYNPIYGDYFVRIRYNFGLPILANQYGSISGQMHSITFGFGMFIRRFKRDY